MKKYEYKGYVPYGAGQMYCLDSFVEGSFSGNVTEEVLKSQGEFKIINKHKAVLFIQDMEIDFVK